MKEGRGYFVIARNTEETDYVRLAYGLALSIKASQTKYDRLSIGVDIISDVPMEYRWVFDQIIEIPWDNSDTAVAMQEFDGKIQKMSDFNEFVSSNFTIDPGTNEWRFKMTNGQRFKHECKVFDMTPYEETIKLEADMLLLSDISHWWDDFAKHNVQIANTVLDYKNTVANTDYYRRCFIANNLYSAHSCMTFFNESEEAKTFFTTLKTMFHDWDHFSWHMIRSEHQTEPTTDIVYGMAVSLLNKKFAYQPRLDDRTFVHMKSRCMPWVYRQHHSENWTKCIPHSFTPKLELFVANYKQTKPFHYHVKEFLTDEIISYYEDAVK